MRRKSRAWNWVCNIVIIIVTAGRDSQHHTYILIHIHIRRVNACAAREWRNPRRSGGVSLALLYKEPPSSRRTIAVAVATHTHNILTLSLHAWPKSHHLRIYKHVLSSPQRPIIYNIIIMCHAKYAWNSLWKRRKLRNHFIYLFIIFIVVVKI